MSGDPHQQHADINYRRCRCPSGSMALCPTASSFAKLRRLATGRLLSASPTFWKPSPTLGKMHSSCELHRILSANSRPKAFSKLQNLLVNERNRDVTPALQKAKQIGDSRRCRALVGNSENSQGAIVQTEWSRESQRCRSYARDLLGPKLPRRNTPRSRNWPHRAGDT